MKIIVKIEILAFLFLIQTSAFAQSLNGRPIKTGVWKGVLGKYMAGEILVKIKPNVNVARVDSAFQSLGLSYIKHFDETRWACLSCDTSANIFDVIDNNLSKISELEIAEPNVVLDALLIPNDPWVNSQLGLNSPDDEDIDAFEAWDVMLGAPNLMIAILDGGIDLVRDSITGKDSLCNPDLDNKNRYLLGFNCIDDTVCHSADTFSVADEGHHGTGVTGIVAAETNNLYGMAGTIWNCWILVIKATSHENSEALQYSNAIRKASETGAKIINCSVGNLGWGVSIMEDAIAHAESLGSLIVAAVGDEGDRGMPLRFPAGYASWGTRQGHTNGYRNVISVGAPANWSNYSDSLLKVIVTAPGVTYTTANCVCCGQFSGTSAAAPYVTGVTGLILSKYPAISPDSVRTIIENTSDKIWQDPNSVFYENNDTIYHNWHPRFGFGRVNAYRAVTLKTLKAPLLDSAKVVRDAQDTTSWIQLFWRDISADEDSFWIYRTVLDTPYQFSKVASTNKNSITYSDHRNNLIGSETYIYRVRTYEDTSRSGNFSDSAKVTNIPREPQNLHGIVQIDSSCEEELGMMESFGEIDPEAAPPPNCYSNIVELRWQPPSPQKSGTISEYKIYFHRTDGRHEGWITVPYPDTHYYFCMCYGKTYDFWVHTKDIYGAQSVKSNKVTKTGTSIYICGCDPPPPTKAGVPDDNPNDKTQVIPTEFSLSQNYPNPFNLSTQIKYSLPQDANVQIMIYNILGQKIRNFDLGYQTAGYKNVFWDGKDNSENDVASGIYFYRISAGEFNQSMKMTLLK